MNIETTLKNAKAEAFNTLLNAVRIHDASRFSEKDIFENLAYIREASMIHGWLCSKYARHIKNSLRSPFLQEIYIEAYDENYLK